jgi:hypothetical protein
MIDLKVILFAKWQKLCAWVFVDEYPNEERHSFWEWWKIKMRD